jgi:uncharacterized protein
MKKKIKAWMPDPKTLKEDKSMQLFGTLLHNPNLWHLNRRSVSGAFAVGLFMAFVPVPFQMLLAAAGAIIFHVNLPVSVALVWVSNPVTMPPLFYGAYLLGATILGSPPMAMEFELSWEWLTTGLGEIWAPFLFGCFIAGSIVAAVSYSTVRYMWRRHILHQLEERRKRFAAKKLSNA